MSNINDRIAGLVEYLITNIVDEPSAVEIASAEQGDDLIINCTVDDGDIGRVIGKDGHTIKAIRTLARACALKDDINVEVELIEE